MNKKALLIISGLAVLALGATILIAMNVAKPTPSSNAPSGQTVANENTGKEPEKPAPTPEPTPPPTPGSDMIRVSEPMPDSVVTSPLTVKGEARGTWYFEASFPAKLYDANGVLLASTPAQAQGDWMTTEFVPFSATLTFKKPATDTGTLVLEKDNPSDLPQNAAHVTINVRFTPAGKESATGPCYKGGCSGQICSGQPDAISTCEFRPEYVCYKDATCERQANGVCGWTMTPTLTSCLSTSK